MAKLATLAAGGGEIELPPWYHDDGVMSDEALVAGLDRFGTKRE